MDNYTYTKVWIDPEFDKEKPIMFDTETGKAPFGESFGGYTRLVQIAQDEKCFIYDTFYMNVDEIKEYLKDCHIVAQNILYDLSCLDFQRWFPEKFDDTMHIARHLLPHLDSFSFKSLAKFFGVDKGDEGNSNWDTSLTKEQLDYAADDVIQLEKIYYGLLEIGDPEKFFTYRLDIKNLRYALRYQLNGLPIHQTNRRKMLRAAIKEQKSLLSKLPSDLNINSPKQVCEFLGSESSSSDTLSELITDGSKDAELIMAARKVTKQIQFLDEKFDADRIYSFFKPSGAKTGRWTASAMKGANPNSQNLQQLPRDMKSVFGYEEKDGRWLVDADYQSLEIFTVIGCMGEENMADIIRSGKDFHKSAAALVYNKPFDEVTKTERTLVKGLNFSLLYGAGAQVAQKMMGSMTGFLTDIDIIEDMKVRWLAAFPNIKEVHAEAGKVFSKIKKGGYAICHSPLGRPMRANSYTEYLAMPPQSTGADATKIAIHLIYDKMPHARLVNTVHDSITFECFSKEEAEELSKVVKECMDESWKIMLPMMKVENLKMNNVSEVVKNLGEGS